MGATTFTTKLDAVNIMLALIGERPLNNLVNLNRAKAIAAVNDLDRITKRTLTEGWWFNRFEEVDIFPVGGKYPIPDHWSGVDLSSSTSLNLVVRDGFLFDMKTQADTGFTDTIKIDYIELLEFERIPHVAREAIATAAAVLFVGSQLGSALVLSETRENSLQAWETFEGEELKHLDANLQHMPEISRVMRRRR